MENSKTLQKPKRDSTIELLRIISIIMIVFHHFAIHGNFEWDEYTITLPHVWQGFCRMWGKVGVNVFVMISGYFLVNNKDLCIKSKKILKFWGQVFFYSISIHLLFMVFSNADFGMKKHLEAVLPITFSSWWFASDYFVLFLIHPFINKLLWSLDKKQYQVLIILILTLWSLIPTFTTSDLRSNSLIWFIVIYAVAGYIRIYGFNPKYSAKHYFAMFGLFSILTYSSYLIFCILGKKWHPFAAHSFYFFDQNTVTILLMSMSLFMGFTKIKLNYHKWINVISSATFGVYLIHDNRSIRSILWSDIFKNSEYGDKMLLIPYSLFTVLTIFAVCTLIDLIRQYTVEKLYIKVLDKVSVPLDGAVSKTTEFISQKVFGK